MTRGWFAASLAALVITRGLVWWVTPLTCEDSYITFRYAENLASGLGLVFNPGERVMGFTSLPWALWLALGHSFGASFEGWARTSALICDALTLVMVCRSLPKAPARCFAVMFAGLAPFAGICVSGMESSAFLCAIAAAAIYRRWWMLALVALIRPEGLLVAMVLSLWMSWRDRTLAVVTVGAVAAALWAYYGSPIPNSVVAKASVYGVHPLMSAAWWEWLLPIKYGKLISGEAIALQYWRVLMLPAFFLGALKLQGAPRRLALASGAVWASYIVTGAAYFAWYLTVPLACCALVVACGLPQMLRGRLAWASLIAILAVSWPAAAGIYQGRARNERDMFAGPAEYLRTHASPRDTILLEPIGIIGQRSKLHVIDEIGLISPRVLAERRAGNGWYARVIRSARPRWVMFRKSFADSGAAYSGAGRPFLSRTDARESMSGYDGVAMFGSGPGAMVLMRRRDGSP